MLLCKCKLSFGVAKQQPHRLMARTGGPYTCGLCTAERTAPWFFVAFIFKMSGGLEERTASEVHATLCELVTTNAAAHPAWSEYAAVLLSPASVAFFEGRLSDAKAGSGADESEAADAELICEHCGGAVPLILLRVACMDGTTLDVTVPQRGLVREVKRSVGQVRGSRAASHSPLSDSPLCLAWCFDAVARHAPGPDRALRRRHRERAA